VSDARTLLERAGRAAARLEGLRAGDRFVRTLAMTVAAPAAPLKAAPEAEAEQLDQLLFGEGFDVLEIEAGWAFGQARRDGYVGWSPLAALTAGEPAPSHRVSTLRTFAFAEPHVRAPSWGPLSLNALVRVEAETERFLRVAGAGWVARDHLSPIGVYEPDPAAVAQRYLGAPYLWGGRDSLGLDCSGLVQQAFYACGRACPRDSDQQERLGQAVGPERLDRNDLVFWQGHVGLMLDAGRLIHANSHHMGVAVEPLAQAVARIEAAGGGAPIAFRRV
jgi:hypothetical protein